MGWKPMMTNHLLQVYILMDYVFKLFLVEVVLYLGSYDLTVSVCIVYYMEFGVFINCIPYTLVVQRGMCIDMNVGLFKRLILVYYVMSCLLFSFKNLQYGYTIWISV